MSSREKGLLCLIVLFGLALRFFFFLDPSIWSDEGQRIWVAMSTSLFEMKDAYQTTGHDQPFGMYPLLHAWIQLFGWSPAALRSFSVVASGLSILTTALAANWIFKKPKYALLAALFMAISPYSIRYGYDVTQYCLINLLAPLSVGLFVRHVRRVEGIAVPSLLLVNAALLSIHYFSYFLVLAEAVIWLFLSLGELREKLKNAAIAGGIYAIVSIPILILMDPAAARDNQIAISMDGSAVNVLLNLFGYSRSLQLFLSGLFLILLANSIRKGKAFSPLAIVVGTTFGFVYVSQWVFWDVLGRERYLMVLYPALLLWTVELIQRFDFPRVSKNIIVALWVAGATLGIIKDQPNETIQDFEAAANWIATQNEGAVAQNLLLAPQCCNRALYYYLTLDQVALKRLKIPPFDVLSRPELLEAATHDDEYSEAKKIFLVLFFHTLKNEADYEQTLERFYQPIDKKTFVGVSVHVFRPYAKKSQRRVPAAATRIE